MQIFQVKIDDLKEADYNPRQLTEYQHKHLKESIEKFGLVDPIIVNKHKDRQNVVVGGHQRLKIARELGFKEVPVVYVDLELEREKELNLRLNRNLGQFDYDMLANHFDPEFLVDIGFEAGELGMYDSKAGDAGFDANKMAGSLDTYMNSSIKQIVLYFDNKEFDVVIPKLEKMMAEESLNGKALESNTDCFNFLLKHYENSKSK